MSSPPIDREDGKFNAEHISPRSSPVVRKKKINIPQLGANHLKRLFKGNKREDKNPLLESNTLLERIDGDTAGDIEDDLDEERIRALPTSKYQKEMDFLQNQRETQEVYMLSKRGTKKERHGAIGGIIKTFGEYTVTASEIKSVYPPEHMRLISSIPEGFGTVPPPDDDGIEEEVFSACSLFLLGFFCVVPWFFGALYIKSQNAAARIAGIVSLLLGFLVGIVMVIVFIFD
ncbi:hypothetical protein PROFUN_13097 [Planoprotostelium fungivorum]|uniref:Transmembrane protein n=1 Tax=Planoprotostelium fungivorum TaxID=1890364 RepID=A0A2P6N5C6_9EUKA|nr:hypothetical protein PROFUN_13097 [Planoprotostelium fungivorum]